MAVISQSLKSRKYIVLLLSLASFSSYAIVKQDYYLMIGLLGFGLTFYLLKNPENIIYLLFFSFMFLDWLSIKWSLIPRQLTWLPEILSLITLLIILILSATNKEIPFKAPYRLVYIFVLLSFFGIFLNKVSMFVAITGIRNHLTFVPFFLLPFYHQFSEDFIKRFLKFLLFFSFFQCPVAIIQRLTFTSQSGDLVGGTLGASTSGVLSLFCAMIIILWTAYYFKIQVKSHYYLLGIFLLFLPMAINETKISLFLIPIVFISMILFIPEARKKIRYFLGLLLLIILLFSLFTISYDYYYAKDSEHAIENYISSPEKILDYIHFRKYNKSGELNRIPQIIFAYENINKKSSHFLFGVGVGNASDSFFSSANGYYYKKHETLGINSIFIANMLWEYGFFGTLYYFIMCTFMFIKVYAYRNAEGIFGTVTIFFLGMNMILLISTIYLNTMRVNLFIFSYWFLAGYLLNQSYHKTHHITQAA